MKATVQVCLATHRSPIPTVVAPGVSREQTDPLYVPTLFTLRIHYIPVSAILLRIRHRQCSVSLSLNRGSCSEARDSRILKQDARAGGQFGRSYQCKQKRRLSADVKARSSACTSAAAHLLLYIESLSLIRLKYGIQRKTHLEVKISVYGAVLVFAFTAPQIERGSLSSYEVHQKCSALIRLGSRFPCGGET